MSLREFFLNGKTSVEKAEQGAAEAKALTDKINGIGEKVDKLNLNTNNDISLSNLEVTEKASVKSLDVNNFLSLNGGKLYMASRHPEETNHPKDPAKLCRKDIVIAADNWIRQDENIGTETEPVTKITYFATVDVAGLTPEGIVEIGMLEADDLDADNTSYMAYASFAPAVDYLKIILNPLTDEKLTNINSSLKRPEKNIAFSVFYLD